MMSIQIKYFASLREHMGRAEDTIAAQPQQTVAEVWVRVAGDRPLPANTLVAVNMEYSRLDSVVSEGDEVAFFPPVTGG